MQRQLTGKDNSLIDLLGKTADSREVAAFAAEFGPLESQDSPPFRVYLGAPDKGIDLLVEHGKVLDVQIRARASKTYKPFAGELPFGLQPGMTQNQVHQALGVPMVSDEFDSRYELRPGIVLVVCYAYGGSLEIQQLHVSLRKEK